MNDLAQKVFRAHCDQLAQCETILGRLAVLDDAIRDALSQQPVRGLLVRIEDWIRAAPHGENCFLHDDGGEFDNCFCGKDALLTVIQEFLDGGVAPTTPSRCPCCKYQYGHQIGCKNNPFDVALASSNRKNGGRTLPAGFNHINPLDE